MTVEKYVSNATTLATAAAGLEKENVLVALLQKALIIETLFRTASVSAQLVTMMMELKLANTVTTAVKHVRHLENSFVSLAEELNTIEKKYLLTVSVSVL